MVGFIFPLEVRVGHVNVLAFDRRSHMISSVKRLASGKV
jgi:hypothetical protein